MNEIIAKFKKDGKVIDINNLEKYENEFKNRKRVEPKPDFWKGKNVLVTGVAGFVGSHLAEKLISYGCNVSGIIRRRAVPYQLNIEHIKKDITLYTADLSSPNQLNVTFREVKPDIVFHLAAESFVPLSFSEPSKVVESNLCGTINLLEAARAHDTFKIHIAGSSEQYGTVKPEDCPINEDTPFNPMSVYAITKIAKEQVANLYNNSYSLPTVVTRAFNHTGPRRGLDFVTANIVKQIVANKRKGNSDIHLGNTSAFRDFTDVRDVIRGYMLVAENGKPKNPYVLSSGKSISIVDLIKMAMKIADVKMNVIIDTERFRPLDVPFLLGDYTKIKEDMGWEPTIPLTHTIQDMFEYLNVNAHLLS